MYITNFKTSVLLIYKRKCGYYYIQTYQCLDGRSFKSDILFMSLSYSLLRIDDKKIKWFGHIAG